MIQSPTTPDIGAGPVLSKGHKAGSIRFPFPQHVALATGTIKPSHIGQSGLDDDVVKFYAHWKEHYVVPVGVDNGCALYRISYGKENPQRTVSEGQGYGMVIVAHMAGSDPEAQTIFDGLWRFSRMHPSCNDPALMAWQVPPGRDDPDSAFDGDADIAYGLILADAQWGSDGAVNYAQAARTTLSAILKSTIGAESQLPLLGDWVGDGDRKYHQNTPRPSDFMPAHFRAFARFSGDARWTRVVDNVQALIATLQADFSPDTGLLPDFVSDARPAGHDFLEGPHDDCYSYNSARVPWRIGTDAVVNGNAVSIAQARKMSAWIEAAAAADPQCIGQGYSLAGRPLKDTDCFTTLFAAPFGVAGMCNPDRQAWLNAVYDAVRTRHEDYFEDSVNLLSLLVMTGNYWDPTR
jgi:endoglucanase